MPDTLYLSFSNSSRQQRRVAIATRWQRCFSNTFCCCCWKICHQTFSVSILTNFCLPCIPMEIKLVTFWLSFTLDNVAIAHIANDESRLRVTIVEMQLNFYFFVYGQTKCAIRCQMTLYGVESWESHINYWTNFSCCLRLLQLFNKVKIQADNLFHMKQQRVRFAKELKHVSISYHSFRREWPRWINKFLSRESSESSCNFNFIVCRRMLKIYRESFIWTMKKDCERQWSSLRLMWCYVWFGRMKA